MQVYPAYTVDRIETELSSREMESLMAEWKDSESSYKSIIRIEDMVKRKFGFKRVSSKPLSGDALKNRLLQEGLL